MPDDAPNRSTDALVALADRCVQCGLCLPVCPTYGRDRLEAESPRGRIALARAWALETIDATVVGDAHLDHCLGCRNCETACPAGVEYDALLVLARGRQRERRRAGVRQRLAERLASRPGLMTRVIDAYRTAYRWLPQRWRPLPKPPSIVASRPAPARPGHPTVALFVGCVAGPYESAVRAGLERLCAATGVDLLTPQGQTCCGTLHAHAGNLRESARLAERNRSAFADTGTVLTLASGCHEAVARALPGSETVDAISFIERVDGGLAFRAHEERVALHLPCSQRNASGSVPALRRLLARIPGLQVIELDAGFGCCGAAGTQMLTDPARASEYRAPLLAQLQASGATRVLSANIGCRLHLGNGTALPVEHPVEFLAGLALPPEPPKTHDHALESPR